MLDRLMQLIPRLAATDDHRHPSIESFRDLRIAFNALDLRRLTRKLGGEAPRAIDLVLDDVRQYFEMCVDQRVRQPVPESLRSLIDAAVTRVTAQGLANASAPSPTSQTSARHLREALHALVGLRLSLFPATLITPTPPEPEAAA
jgi:hypothetical protein